MSVKWAMNTTATSLLLAEFENVKESSGFGLRWAIGNALGVLASDDILDELIKLATDKKYGTARQMIVFGLGKLKDQQVIDVLINLLNDDDVISHAVTALGKLKTKKAIPHIKPLLNHPKPLVRREAKKAIMKIEKN
ncbi:MAG: HEAT repeat domain-containing protein [Spirochaetes bacterium]|nr:HEAT repeat domain-containing protein [Spirochaetota bacterium]